jgi:hypothetical protein
VWCGVVWCGGLRRTWKFKFITANLFTMLVRNTAPVMLCSCTSPVVNHVSLWGPVTFYCCRNREPSLSTYLSHFLLHDMLMFILLLLVIAWCCCLLLVACCLCGCSAGGT